MSKLNKENKLNKTNYTIRHGEVTIHAIPKLPKGSVQNVKTFIVGHSETGHHHVLESAHEFKVTTIDKERLYLELFEPAKLVHQKTVNRHRDLVIPAGTYEITHKVEYNPFTKAMSQVWD